MFSAALLILLILAVFNRLVGRSWLYPPAAFTALWFMALLALHSCGDTFYSISTTTLLVYALGGEFFTVGGLGISVLVPTSRRRVPCVSPVRRRHIRTVLDVGLAIAIALLPRYLAYLTELASQSNLSNFWQRVRMGEVAAGSLPGGGPFRLAAWLIPIYTIFALVAYFEHDGSKAWRWRTWAWVAVALLYQLLSTGKSGVMLLMVGLVAVTWIKQRRAPVRFLLLCTLVLGAVFMANHIILHKSDASTDLSINEDMPALLEGFSVYTVGSLVGFDAVVSNPHSVKNTWKLYKFFVGAANKLGAKYPELPQNLQYTPISSHSVTNVYTIYFPYYAGFGLLGVAGLSFLIGTVSTAVYCLAVRLRPLGVILYCAALYGIVMSVFAELFFLQIGFWLKSVAIVCVLYYLPPILGRSCRTVVLRQVRT